MPWNNKRLLTDADGNFIPQVWDPSQNKFVPYEAKVQLSGTIFGADISDRPPAHSVPVGTIFVITNTELDAWISNGTNWVVL